MDNYRGITVATYNMEDIETVIRDRLQQNILNVQNTVQRDFMSVLSPLNASVEEFYRESKDKCSEHLILLDAKAPFDVDQHTHILSKIPNQPLTFYQFSSKS